ncbi:glutamate ABC transporter substrate-binding protein [Demequina aurantiaca]|uniref:glutamate ABC transporter substrate-binding protein n=1 Tax=Demequina aurantiaca TaxID=676200 RepID=UPI003D332472
MNTKIKVVALAATAAIALSACSSDSDGGDDVDASSFPAGSTMATLADAGAITIGTKFDQPLFGLKAPSGEPEGFDVEVAKIIAGELGISDDNITWTETVSANREPFIEGGQVDMVVATYTINDDRKEIVSFAGPYYNAGQAMMVLSDNEDIVGPEDMAGKVVCSVEGSTPAQNVMDNYPDAELKLFGAYTDCLQPLRDGTVDVVTTDNVILAGYVSESDGDFKVAGDPFTEEPYGIGVGHDDDEFRSWINDVLEASFEDGSWIDAWNETAGTVLPEPVTPTVDRYTNS